MRDDRERDADSAASAVGNRAGGEQHRADGASFSHGSPWLSSCYF
jgi:hypothetical protein